MNDEITNRFDAAVNLINKCDTAIGTLALHAEITALEWPADIRGKLDTLFSRRFCEIGELEVVDERILA